MIRSTLFSSIIIACLAPSSVALADCTKIPQAGNQSDGAWLFWKDGAWQPIDDLKSVVTNGQPRKVSFAYIAKDRGSGSARRGVLVIKSGISTPTASTRGELDKVTLEREDYSKTEDNTKKYKCEEFRPFSSGSSVNSRSYDDYHDIGSRTKDDATLNSFHIKYAGRSGCRWTNDATSDSYFSGKWRSNRSQFSFDPRIVEKGQPSSLVAMIFGVDRAYASSYSGRRVEIRKYRADNSGLACVFFNRRIEPGGFLRINDLERGGIFRAPEQSWSWPN